MRKLKKCACESSSGELAVKAAMEAELFRRGKNGDFALTEIYLALRLWLGSGEEDNTAAGKIEMVTVWWHGC